LGLLTLCAIWLGGCSTCQVQIWANSDSNDPRNYTLNNPHYAYAGETVNFHIMTQPDIASYVMLKCDGDYDFLPKVGPGEYAFTKTFDPSWRNQHCDIDIRAYRRVGRSDYYQENGKVLKRHDRDEPIDQEIGFASMRLICYQSTVRIKLSTKDKKEPNWSKGELALYGAEDAVSRVQWGRAGSDGFTAIGCDDWGTWIVFYEPKWDEVCRAGRTRVVFSVPDPSTNETITKEIWIDTP
jgi:hypothetical protein